MRRLTDNQMLFVTASYCPLTICRHHTVVVCVWTSWKIVNVELVVQHVTTVYIRQQSKILYIYYIKLFGETMCHKIATEKLTYY